MPFGDIYDPIRSNLASGYGATGVAQLSFKGGGGQQRLETTMISDRVGGFVRTNGITLTKQLNRSGGGVSAWQLMRDGQLQHRLELPVSRLLLGSGNNGQLQARITSNIDVQAVSMDGSIGLDFERGSFGASIDVPLPAMRGEATAVASAVAGAMQDRLLLGAQCEIDAFSPDVLAQFDLGASYSDERERCTVALQLERRASQLRLGATMRIRPDLTLVHEVVHDLSSKSRTQSAASPTDEAPNKPLVSFGIVKWLAFGMSVRAKMDTSGSATACFALPINQELSASFTIECPDLLLPASSESGGGGGHTSRLGVSLQYSPKQE